MNTTLLGRLVLSFVLLVTIAALIVFQWIGIPYEHVFNPKFHPHGRFHIAQLVFIVSAMSMIELWVVWRHSLEPRLVRVAVTAFPVLVWAGEFFAFFVPGTGPSPDPANPATFQLVGITVHGNLLFASVLIVLSGVGYMLVSRGQKTNHEQRSLGVASLMGLTTEDEDR